MKMIICGIICGLTIIGNCILLSATISSPLKVDPSSLHFYKTGLRNELDYILKRNAPVQNVDETPDSKERRSQMGSSFIRFGRTRNEDNQENFEYPMKNNFNDVEDIPTALRVPHGRSDVIIRFGRATKPKLLFPDERDKNFKLLPIALEQLYLACPDVLASIVDSSDTDLTRLCSSLTTGFIQRENNNK